METPVLTEPRIPGPRVRVRWKQPGRWPIDADEAARVLDEIRDHNHGHLRPADVVEAARRPDHPLHDLFEWNDTVAARLHREAQARTMIRHIVITRVNERDTVPVRYYVNLTRDGERSYDHTVTVMGDREMQRQVLETARRELAAFRTKYGHLREFRDLVLELLSGPEENDE